MNKLNHKRKIRALYNRNVKYKNDYIIAFIIGVLFAITGYITYLDFIKRGGV